MIKERNFLISNQFIYLIFHYGFLSNIFSDLLATLLLLCLFFPINLKTFLSFLRIAKSNTFIRNSNKFHLHPEMVLVFFKLYTIESINLAFIHI